MNIKLAVTIACILSLISACWSARRESNCTDCIIIINNETGDDNPSCLQINATSITPCKTLSYVLNHTFLSNRDVVLQGDHYVNRTLTVSDVDGLTLRGSDGTNYFIYCMPPNSSADKGSGLVFESLSNVVVLNVIFEGCGTLQYSTTLRNGVNVEYRSAVYIINSTNISFSDAGFHKSVGRGLSLHDVTGYVEINNTNCLENKVPEVEQMILFGGGGIYIEFTHCTPGYPNCNQKDNTHNKNSRYVIKDCVFEGNIATNNEITAQLHIIQFRQLTGSDGNNAGQGGGIHITFKGTTLLNSIRIHNCTFHRNSAQYGGGIDAVLQDNSCENTIYVSACTFTNNLALERTGGALNLGYTSGHSVAHNIINVQDTKFINNSAGRGGAVSFFSSRYKTAINNRLQFINCTWTGNSASIGAAMSLRPTAGSSIFDGITPTPLLCRCSFTNNRVINTAAFLKSASDGKTQHVLESGVLHIESVEVKFYDFVLFSGSTGSAIVATSSQINVLENTQVQFVNNTATYGGAMALLGFSVLQLYPNSQISFDSNYANELGGAVYATSPHQAEFIFSHKCFFSHKYSTNPDNWNTSLTFTHLH